VINRLILIWGILIALYLLLANRAGTTGLFTGTQRLITGTSRTLQGR
jgi:hypothetical protein